MKKFITIGILLVCFSLVLTPLVFAGKPSARGAKPCSDGIDNDGDGYTDWPSDPGCSSKKDNSELNPNIECDDGSDNDGDGDTDVNDAGCSSPSDDDETNCGDDVAEGGEVCDGTDLGGETCSSQGYDGGTLSCNEQCNGFVTTSCYADTCSDNDGGYAPWTYGTTSGDYLGSPYSNNDYCVDTSNVMEYYCSGDYEYSSSYFCGTDYHSNISYCSEGDVYHDFYDYSCASGACDEDITPILDEECDYGCTSGTCDPMPDTCSETDDGWDPINIGITSGYFSEVYYSDTDYCLDGTNLMEFYCVGNVHYNFSMNCEFANETQGICSNGECI